MEKKIISLLKEKGPCTQMEVSKGVGKINRAVLLGYLRCLCDLKKVRSKRVGKALVYFI
jgi:predicted transcriptional regulator